MNDIDLINTNLDNKNIQKSIPTYSTKSISMDILDESNNEFKIDNENSRVFFNEIIKEVGFKNWDNFCKLCELPLPWFDFFEFAHIYELDKRDDTYELNQTTNTHMNFLNMAAEYFPDRYANHIAKIMIEEINKNPNKYDFREYIQKSLISSLLLNNKKETYSTLEKSNYIKVDDIINTVFISDYKKFRKFAQKFLQDKNTVEHLFGDINNSIEPMFPIYAKNKNSIQILNNLKLLIIDVDYYIPEKKEEIANIFIPFVLDAKKNSWHNKEILAETMKTFIGYGFVDIHSVYMETEKRLAQKTDVINNSNHRSIEQIFSLSKELITSAYELKANLLQESLLKKEEDKGYIKNKTKFSVKI